MRYLEINIATAPAGIEEVAAVLTAGGFPDLVLEDQQELEGFLEQNRAYWDYIDESLQEKLQGLSRITLYLEEDDAAGVENLKTLLADLKARKGEELGSLELTAKPLPETNWEESWKENYPPVFVGENLVVLPYWLAESDDSGRLPVILDPGLTFGTGAHPSTRMVMAAMEQRLRSGDRCLDLGSGSGILSITALRLGAKNAIGVDIDPKAEDIARENAAYNQFAAPEFTALTGNVLTDKNLMQRLKEGRYELVFVNIVADVIVALSPVLPAFLQENSTLICSGILDNRLPDVVAALQGAGLTITEVKEEEQWRCVCAVKGKRSDI